MSSIMIETGTHPLIFQYIYDSYINLIRFTQVVFTMAVPQKLL